MGAGASFADEDSDFDDADALFGGRGGGQLLLQGDEAATAEPTAFGGLVMMRSGRDGFPPDQYTQHVRDLGGGHIRIIHRSVHRVGDRSGMPAHEWERQTDENALEYMTTNHPSLSVSRGPRFLSTAASGGDAHPHSALASSSSSTTPSYSSAMGSRRTSAGGTAILPRYACHRCHRTFILRENSGLFCPYCNCDFVEEVEHTALAAVRGRGSGGLGGPFSDSGASVSSLTADQQVRLISAAAFLQMLEIHLRDEILSLRNALDAGGASAAAPKTGPRKLTARERHAALRTLQLDTDSVCGQPSCPICSEDFKEGMTVTQIQCSHFFHDACVLPWLEMKRSCPICRFEISAAAPQPETLGALTESELRGRIRWLGGPADLKGSKPDLAALLCRELTQHLDKFEDADDKDEDDEDEDASVEHSHYSQGGRYNPFGRSSSDSSPIAPSSVLGALTASAAAASRDGRNRGEQPQHSRVVMRPGYTYTISSSGAISTHSAPSAAAARPTAAVANAPSPTAAAGTSADID